MLKLTATVVALANDLHDRFGIDYFNEDGYADEGRVQNLVSCVSKWVEADREHYTKHVSDTTRNAEQPMTQYMRDELEGMAEGFAEEESQDAEKETK